MQKMLCVLLLLSSTFSLSGQDFDILILNGKVIDGTGNPWRLADIGVKDGKIAAIGHLSGALAVKTIDAAGKVVCPGFIDVHAHVEGSIENRPAARNFLHDGVTTLVTGNCGGSRIDIGNWFRELETKKLSINIASLIGHNSVRRTVMGNEDRDPTPEELQNMETLVQRGMEQGAVGLSTGLIYLPGAFAKTPEIVALARVAHTYGGVYASHIRQEDDRVLDAINEAAVIGEESGIPVEISHFKITGKTNWGRTGEMIRLVESYRKKGVDVTVDQYPYTASSTGLDVLLPEWSREGANEEVAARLTDRATRKKVLSEMKTMLARTGFKNYAYAVVAGCPWDSTLNGKNITEITALSVKKPKTKDEMETVIDMVAKGRRVQMVYHKMNEEDVKTLMRLPYAMVASDAGIPAFGVGNPHPRAYGTNARVLGRYVRELGILSLEDAIRKMTSLPAQKFNLHDRGLLLVGMAADILVLDPDKVSDTASYDHPHAYSTGIEQVIVNGLPVIEDGKHNGAGAGQVLRGPGYHMDQR